MKWQDLKVMIENRKHRDQIYCRPEFWDEKCRKLQGDAISMWPNNHLNALYGREQSALLARWLPNLREKEVLDIGCGTGRLSRQFARAGAKVTAFDFSTESIRLAREWSKDLAIHFHVASVFDLEDTNRYDLAVSWGVLAIACRNREEATQALARIYRSIRPGGCAVFLEPIHCGFLRRVLNLSREEFVQLLLKVGFTVQETKALHFWPMRLLLAYLPWPAWVTLPLFHLGQLLMRLTGGNIFGDYYAFRCLTPSQGVSP